MIEKTPRTELVEQEELLEYKNQKLPIADRVADLLGRITIHEKVAQMLCIWCQKKSILYDRDGKLNLNNLGLHFGLGIGQIGRLSDTGGGQKAEEMTNLANALQNINWFS